MSDRPKDSFVIWLEAAETGPAPGAELRGRIEHVPTSIRETFSDREQLLAFIDRMGDPTQTSVVRTAHAEPERRRDDEATS